MFLDFRIINLSVRIIHYQSYPYQPTIMWAIPQQNKRLIRKSKECKKNFITYFPLYIYIENFKNLLVRNHWIDFHIILQKCSFGDPLPRLFKPFGFIKKYGRQGQGLFSLYIYIENFKNLLVRNHWTDFHIILQKCSFGDPLPRLFKPFGFVKKHGRQGTGLIFTIYLYRKL